MTTPSNPTGDAKVGNVAARRVWFEDGVWHEKDITADEFYRDTRTPPPGSLDVVAEVLEALITATTTRALRGHAHIPSMRAEQDATGKARALLTRIKDR